MANKAQAREVSQGGFYPPPSDRKWPPPVTTDAPPQPNSVQYAASELRGTADAIRSRTKELEERLHPILTRTEPTLVPGIASTNAPSSPFVDELREIRGEFLESLDILAHMIERLAL